MDLYQKGLARNPEDPELLNNYSQALRTLGYLKDALRVKDQLALLEPLIGLYNRQRGELLLANGKADEGTTLLAELSAKGTGGAVIFLPAAYAQQGRLAEAVETLTKLTAASGPYSQPLINSEVQVLRAVANKTEPPEPLPAFDSEQNFIYAYTKKPERMLDWPEKAVSEGDYRPIQFLWWPTPSSVRKTERFKALVRKAGLVDYWRTKGWPDLCHPFGTDDFVCD